MPPKRVTAVVETEEMVVFERAGETADAVYDDHDDEWLCDYQTEHVNEKDILDDRTSAVMWCMNMLDIIEEHPQSD